MELTKGANNQEFSWSRERFAWYQITFGDASYQGPLQMNPLQNRLWLSSSNTWGRHSPMGWSQNKDWSDTPTLSGAYYANYASLVSVCSNALGTNFDQVLVGQICPSLSYATSWHRLTYFAPIHRSVMFRPTFFWLLQDISNLIIDEYSYRNQNVCRYDLEHSINQSILALLEKESDRFH